LIVVLFVKQDEYTSFFFLKRRLCAPDSKKYAVSLYPEFLTSLSDMAFTFQVSSFIFDNSSKHITSISISISIRGSFSNYFYWTSLAKEACMVTINIVTKNCSIYCRKSTEEGLDMDFNTLPMPSVRHAKPISPVNALKVGKPLKQNIMTAVLQVETLTDQR